MLPIDKILNSNVIIASITVISQAQILLVNKPHANPNHARPNVTDTNATAYTTFIIVLISMDLVSWLSSFVSVRLEIVSNSEVIVDGTEYIAMRPTTRRIIPLIIASRNAIVTASGRLFCIVILL